jgi:transcriptional/translational regulatory protein YebC/TACO1
LSAVAETLKAAGVNADDASVTRVPQNMVHIDANQSATALRLLDALDELEDVQEVFTNADFAENAVPA